MARWRLTRDGEHLFPKQYDQLAGTLLDTIANSADPDTLDRTLAGLVDRQVADWSPRLDGADLDQRLTKLTGIYAPDDQYTTVERDDRGVALVERNCPYHDVAHRHPALCGLTLNTLSRLLGWRVVREATFQAGDGRCVFRVTDEPVDEPTYVVETQQLP